MQKERLPWKEIQLDNLWHLTIRHITNLFIIDVLYYLFFINTNHSLTHGNSVFLELRVTWIIAWAKQVNPWSSPIWIYCIINQAFRKTYAYFHKHLIFYVAQICIKHINTFRLLEYVCVQHIQPLYSTWNMLINYVLTLISKLRFVTLAKLF